MKDRERERGARNVLSSVKVFLDLSTANHLYHETLQTLSYLTIHPTYQGYNIYPLLLGITFQYYVGFPPQFELIEDWTPTCRTGFQISRTNQWPLDRFSNSSGKLNLIVNLKPHEVGVGRCKHDKGLINSYTEMAGEYEHATGTP